MSQVVSLSVDDARKLVLLSQSVFRSAGRSEGGVMACIQQLGYVQIDSISVVQRAHHHTLWNRVTGYQPGQLERLVKDKQVFEYWAHAAAYLPMSDYRFSLPRKRAIAGGDKHWFSRDEQLMKEVLARITAEGPLMAKDFEQPRQGGDWWSWKPAKKALEQLFMEGELMAVERRGFHKVYELAERVLPADVSTQVPTEEEYRRYLIRRFLLAHGLGKPEQCAYLLKGMSAAMRQQVRMMLADGELLTAEVAGDEYILLPESLDLLRQRLPRQQLKILSPFDNLLIQRKRMQALFGFDYQLECYVPEAKRCYGYFALPLLWGSKFAGRMDVKVQRKSAVLEIKHLHLEDSFTLTKLEPFLAALQKTLSDFMLFNQAVRVEVQRVTHGGSDVAVGVLLKVKEVLEAG